MTFLPSVVAATHAGGFRIRLVFNDGLEATVDFERWLTGPVFEPVRAPRYFSRFFVEGGGVAWSNGADIAPETLYEAARAERSDQRLHPTAAVRERRPKYKAGKRRRGVSRIPLAVTGDTWAYLTSSSPLRTETQCLVR